MIENIPSDKKICVMGDFHGNATYALEALEDAKKKGANYFIITGDLFTDFQQTKELIKILKDLEKDYPVIYISGNREQDLIKKSLGGNDFWSKAQTTAPLLLSYENLTQEDIEWIKTFKDHSIINFDGEIIFITHQTPLTDEQNEIFEKSGSKTIVFGHTHRLYDLVFNNVRYINPGSMGLTENNIENGGTYAIMEKVNDKLLVEQVVVKVNEQQIFEIYDNIDSFNDLQEINWDHVLKFSLMIGRNLATTYLNELRRLVGAYNNSINNGDDDETFKQKAFQLLYQQDLPSSLIFGRYGDTDRNSAPLPNNTTFYDLNGNVYEIPVIHDYNINRLKGMNPNGGNQELIKEIALKNTLYYASLKQVEGAIPEMFSKIIEKSKIIEFSKASYESKDENSLAR